MHLHKAHSYVHRAPLLLKAAATVEFHRHPHPPWDSSLHRSTSTSITDTITIWRQGNCLLQVSQLTPIEDQFTVIVVILSLVSGSWAGHPYCKGWLANLYCFYCRLTITSISLNIRIIHFLSIYWEFQLTDLHSIIPSRKMSVLSFPGQSKKSQGQHCWSPERTSYSNHNHNNQIRGQQLSDVRSGIQIKINMWISE